MKLQIISDIHANWPALRPVVDAEKGTDEIVCLGDLVDYGPQPLRCVQWAIRLKNHSPSGEAQMKDPNRLIRRRDAESTASQPAGCRFHAARCVQQCGGSRAD
jgi:hypothetical protein